jgi:hypothetical protein
MKKLFTLIALIVIPTINAQAPQGFNYQATVRNAAGDLIINQNVTFKFNIMLNTSTSLPVFSETHYVPTDDLGQVNLTVGQGTATIGSFAGINWGGGTYYLGIELKTGANFVAMGTTQLLSVPYALYANSAGSTSGNSGMITPSLITNQITNYDGVSAEFSASVSNIIENQIIKRGFVIADEPNPFYYNYSAGSPPNINYYSMIDSGYGIGNYNGNVDYLNPNTTYYVRSYAITENNIVFYGNEVTFTTSSFNYPNQTVTDLLVEFNKLTNDIFGIIEDQESATYYNPNSDFTSGYIPPCVTITRFPAFGTPTTVGQTVTKTIDFGSVGCTLSNNNFVSGKIIITYVYFPSATSHTITFAFDNFFHNGFYIQGNKTITRTFQASSVFSTPHTIQTLDVDFSIIDASGGEYSFIGSKIRELISGENTQNLYDNFYKETGLWTCNNIYNIPISNSINSPLQIDLSCNFNNISGVMTSSTSNHNYVLDYGTGGCDNNATITIDGGGLINLTF